MWFNCSDGKVRINGSKGKKYASKVEPGSVVEVYVDCEKGTISFCVNDHFKGQAAQCEFIKNGGIFLSVQMLDKGDTIMLVQPDDGDEQIEQKKILESK